MYGGFPEEALEKLRCPIEGAPFILGGGIIRNVVQSSRIQEGSLYCVVCENLYQICEGIVHLVDPSQLDAESAHEQAIRNIEAPQYAEPELGSAQNHMEMQPTIRAVAPDLSYSLLELGCGTGRYTRILAGLFLLILAVDFSLASLKLLSESLDGSSPVGLVNADITRFRTTPYSFERVLSTLTSNLPGPTKRNAMYASVAGALKDGGRFVHSVHDYHLRDRWGCVPKSAHYRKGGIYRYLFTEAEVVAETARFFRTVKIRPIVIRIPLAQRFGLPVVALSGIAEFIPLVNQLGELLLVVAENPLHIVET